ncbi:hypothetical protein Cgig2_013896 [Carnegiea gigantea]|uniref:DUF4283 domain-containing protein n=1 Tax=Carnegiea gigantea TaxID=171969 RepID=A0A9Q1JWL2_9CARY|nr:hypothetical protein Cgig2_013896 [Carnegiea gigantea]
MATCLEDAWKHLSLTAEEEVVVECDEEEMGDGVEQTSLCLWGKLFTSSYFNANAMKNVFKNIWKPSKGDLIRDLDKNHFAFQFFFAVDKAYVLNEGPWAFDRNILLLKELMGFEQPSKEEKRLFLAYRDGKSSNKAKMKLNFDNTQASLDNTPISMSMENSAKLDNIDSR